MVSAQTFKKSNDEFIAYDGQSFKKGDTLILASPSDFSNSYVYYTQGKGREIRKDAISNIKTNNGYHKIDNRFKKLVIKYFRVHSEDGVYAVVGTMFNEMIHINNALRTNEIISKKDYQTLYPTARYFSDTLAYYYSNLFDDSIANNDVIEYLYFYNNESYQHYHQDEFEFSKIVNSTKNTINVSLNQISLKDTLRVNINMTLDQYNFESKSFEITWNRKSLKCYTPIMGGKIYAGDSSFMQKSIILIFKNLIDFRTIKVDEEIANNFIKHRKSSNGRVNRDVNITLHFLIRDLKKEVSKNKREYKFEADIVKMSVFEDKALYYRIDKY